MNTQPRNPDLRLRLGLLVLLCLVTAGTPEAAAASPAEPAAVTAPPASRPPAVVVGGLFEPIRKALNSRSRMVQLATIGMCVALFIMMRK